MKVPVPGGGFLNVPEGTPQEAIDAALAKVSKPQAGAASPNLGAELLGTERPKIDASAEAAGAPGESSPILAALMGFGRAAPGSDIVTAGANALARKIGGADSDFSDLFSRERRKVKLRAGDLKRESPVSTLIGQLVGAGAQYAGGMGAVKAAAPALMQNVIGRMAAGAVVNPVVTAMGGEKPGIEDAAFGAGGELLGTGISKLAKSETLMKLPKAIVSSVIRPFMKSIPEKEQVDLAKEILFRGVKGSPESIRNWADAGRKVVFGELDKAIAPKAKLPITKTLISDELDPIIKGLEVEPATKPTAAKIKDLLKQFYRGPAVNVGEAQAQKVALQGRASGAYKSLEKGGDITDMADYFTAKARGFRKAIEEKVPEAAGLNKEAGILKMIKDIFSQMEKKQAGKSVQIGLKDIAAGGAGAIMMGSGGAAPAAIAQRMVASPRGRLMFAQLIKNMIEGMGPAGAAAQKYLPPAASAISRVNQE